MTNVRTDVEVTDLIRAQHHQVRGLMDTIASASAEARKEPFERLVRLLAVHETAEEMIVYPVVRRLGDDAERVVTERMTEEDRAKKALAGLEGLDCTTQEFGQRFLDFRLDVERHAEAEEAQVLPLLMQHDIDRRTDMARAFELAEKVAPTHAHRMAPESAIGNLLVGPLVSVVDRARDAIKAIKSARR